MLTFIISMVILCAGLWLGFKLTGALLGAIFWLLIKLPVALILFCLGLALCCTIILIPLGIKLFGVAFGMLF